MNNTKDVAKLLANRINQEHYILQYLNEIYYAGFKKGKEEAINYAHSSTLLNDYFIKGRKVWYDTSKLAIITEVINTELVNIKYKDQEFTVRKEFLSLAPEGI